MLVLLLLWLAVSILKKEANKAAETSASKEARINQSISRVSQNEYGGEVAQPKSYIKDDSYIEAEMPENGKVKCYTSAEWNASLVLKAGESSNYFVKIVDAATGM